MNTKATSSGASEPDTCVQTTSHHRVGLAKGVGYSRGARMVGSCRGGIGVRCACRLRGSFRASWPINEKTAMRVYGTAGSTKTLRERRSRGRGRRRQDGCFLGGG